MFHGIMTNGNAKLRFKDSTMATSINEDAGFCSGDDYLELHSPTDSSEDSVEVKVSAITFNHKKRKLIHESRKETSHFTGPLKKRMCLKVKAETNDTSSPSLQGKTPFRPWSPPVTSNFPLQPPSTVKPFSAYFHPPSPVQVEPVSLVIKRDDEEERHIESSESDLRVPLHPEITKLTTAETERMLFQSNEQFPVLRPPSAQLDKKSEPRREQRNYKNMTRERRIEANARERTRVHTISAAFDTLRRSVPSYSHNQKLSKLSVLRIACSYIMTLSTLVQEDESPTEVAASTSECVELVSRTIQREGKLRKKKDDND